MLPLESITFAQLLHRTVMRCGCRTALLYRGQSWSYTRLNEEIDKAAASLLAFGIRPGDHVAIWGEIEPEVLFVFCAIQKLGAVAVMLNTGIEQAELADMVELADASALCVGRSFKENHSLPALCESLPLQKIVSVGSGPACAYPALRSFVPANPAAAAAQIEAYSQAVKPQDTATILFTSGSTGHAKAVMSSHFSRVNGGILQAADLGATEQDVFCVAMPLFHCFCISVNVMASIAVGGCLCVPTDRHIATLLDVIEQSRCTVLSCVPTMFMAMLKNPRFSPERTASLRTGIIGGSSYSPELFETIERLLGMTLLSSLGQTECTAGLTVCSLTDPLSVRAKTVGHFMAHVDGCIKDWHTGETLAPGQIGEICVRGYLLMQGYYKAPEQTAATIDAEGWLHTGDLASIDEAGFITLHGRLKELIIRGGENVSPCEIEAELQRLPEISRCKVVGVPDEIFGEEICACIELRPGTALSAEEIRTALTARLAYYKVPKYILFWTDFPVTSTGKIKPVETAHLAAAELKSAAH